MELLTESPKAERSGGLKAEQLVRRSAALWGLRLVETTESTRASSMVGCWAEHSAC